MLVEQGKYLRWISFPTPAALQPGWRTGYLQVTTKTRLWTHVRRPFLSYRLDISPGPDALWAQYAKKLRQHIRQAQRADMMITRDEDPTAVIQLFSPIAAEKGLNPISREQFTNRPGLLISRAHHPKWGILAAHAYQLDHRGAIAKGLYNASAFRQFGPDKSLQALCSKANALLYHADFGYFHQLGIKTYDFSGYGIQTSGVNFFKTRFRGQVVKQYNYTPIWYFYLRWLAKKLKRG
jgi:hypothetical protein